MNFSLIIYIFWWNFHLLNHHTHALILLHLKRVLLNREQRVLPNLFFYFHLFQAFFWQDQIIMLIFLELQVFQDFFIVYALKQFLHHILLKGLNKDIILWKAFYTILLPGTTYQLLQKLSIFLLIQELYIKVSL